MYNEVTQYSSDITTSGSVRSFNAFGVITAPGAGKFIIYGTALINNIQTFVYGSISNASSRLERMAYLSHTGNTNLNNYGMKGTSVSLHKPQNTLQSTPHIDIHIQTQLPRPNNPRKHQ